MNDKGAFDVISISSDDEDDIPLKAIRATSHCNQSANVGLKTYSDVLQCEFCDKAFLNNYDILVHNAKHIIIPLLKQNVHQCTECLYYFTSQEELKTHMNQKHNVIQSMIDKKLKIELDKFELNDKRKLILEDVKAKDEKSLLRNYLLKTEDFKAKDLIAKAENKFTIETKDKVWSRLQFEEDITDKDFIDPSKGLLCDLTKECKVNMNLFDEPWVDDVAVDVVSDVPKTGDKLSDVPRGDVVDEEYTPSTHYDELVKPGMYKCMRCAETFSTRFQLIQHDMIHIKVRKPRLLLCEFCERFISNSYQHWKRHMVTKHSPDLWNHKQRAHTTCKKCGLKYYNYNKHVKNYHELVYCHLCNKGFDSDDQRLDHIREHLIETKCTQCDLVSTAIEIQDHQWACHRVSNISTIKICETCCLFVKNKHNMQYIFLETISQVGSRLTCERCGKMFFELKLVRRLHKGREKERCEKEKKKHLSNTDRLKNIQQRLKMINKLSRF